MKKSPEPTAPLSHLRTNELTGREDPSQESHARELLNPPPMRVLFRLLHASNRCPAHEHHVRRPGWTELFFDLVFAAAIAQLSAPLDHDYSLPGIARFAFLLTLVFLAWFGYTTFATQFAVEDFVQRLLIVVQIFLVAVMAANATDALDSRDAAGFGAAYGAVRAILALQYFRVRWLPEADGLVERRIGGLLVAAALWALAAMLPIPYRYMGWSVALLVDVGNSWPFSSSTTASPPGATHFPERFGLLTIILLGEFVASVMRGIQSQLGWSFLAAASAILSMALGFAIWSCYSDGAAGCEPRRIRSAKDVGRLRAWIILHLALFLGIGVLGVGIHHAIALPPGEHFAGSEQWIVCVATAGIILVMTGIAATSELHSPSRQPWKWASQFVLFFFVMALAPLSHWMVATALLAIFLLSFIGQSALLILSRR